MSAAAAQPCRTTTHFGLHDNPPEKGSFDEMMEKDHTDSTKGQHKSLSKHFVQFMRVPSLNAGLVHEDESASVDLEAVTVEDLKVFFDNVSIKQQSVKQDGVFSTPVEQVNWKHVLNSASYVG